MMLAVVEQAERPYAADSALMKRVAAGDGHAQRVLAHRLSPRVRRLAMRLLAGNPDAEDAAQNALVEILKSAHTYAERARVERWSDRIAARAILRFAREQRRPWHMRSSIEVEDVAAHEQVAFFGGGGASAEATAENIARDLETYLSQLSDKRRQVLMLKHGLGHTTEEISDLVGAPVGTVKDRLVSARKQLRRLIQRDRRIGSKRSPQ